MWNLDPSKPDKDWAYAGAVDVPLSESGINVSDTFLTTFSYLLLAFDGFHSVAHLGLLLVFAYAY